MDGVLIGQTTLGYNVLLAFQSVLMDEETKPNINELNKRKAELQNELNQINKQIAEL